MILERLGPTGLAQICARRPKVVVGIWVALLVAGLTAAAFGLSVTTDFRMLNNPESVRADEFISAEFPNDGIVSETILVRSESLTVDDPEFQQAIDQLATEVTALDELVAAVYTQDMVAQFDPELATQMVSEDRHAAIVQVEFQSYADALDQIGEFERVLAEITPAGFTIGSVGVVSIDHAFIETSESDLQREILGLPAALVVLVLVFGALVAAGIPLFLGIVAIGVSLGLSAIISQITEVSIYIVNIITVFGLALGIDYSLFIVERYREERRAGIDSMGAIRITVGTASRAVLVSGLTVIVALLGMVIVPTTIFRSLGLGAILVTIVAVAAMLTLVPALLSLFGDHLDWPRRRRAAPSSLVPQNVHRGFWGRVTRVVMGSPVVCLVISVVLLGSLALGVFRMEIGTSGVESLPAGPVRDGYEILERDFSAGAVRPLSIVIDTSRDVAAEDAITALVTNIAGDTAFGPIISQVWNPDETAALIAVPLTMDSSDPAAGDAIDRLRDQLIPTAFAGHDTTVLVGGVPAFDADFNALVDVWTPRVFALVLGLSFFLLVLVFRSIVIPIKAIIMNLLSVGASYGAMVFVFQDGIGAGLLGFQTVSAIEAWIPLLMFCILFGLSMDYHVFLLSRIREHYLQSNRNTESVAAGLHSTARIITGAAAIMVVVFGAFATGELVMFQQLGFGLSLAILLDATIVRSVLVPASMALLGRWNWYLPNWLEWLPRFDVEGATSTSSSDTNERLAVAD